jgi:hypothetical protein
MIWAEPWWTSAFATSRSAKSSCWRTPIFKSWSNWETLIVLLKRLPSRPKEPVEHGLPVLWIGHVGALIQTPTLNIVTEPILFDRIHPKPFPTKTVTHPGVKLESLPRIELILISLGEYNEGRKHDSLGPVPACPEFSALEVHSLLTR